MVEDAQRIFDYLPVSFRNESEQEYINFLWESFVTNYEDKKFPFAFLAYHMLFMSFVYFEIWQIKQNKTEDFEKAMVGFNKDTEKELMESSTPFMLWRVNESLVFRFLKLIGMHNSEIGQYTNMVKERNNAAHSNGNIYVRDQKNIDDKIEEILRSVKVIQTHSVRVVEACYENFLLASVDPENREFIGEEDQIREVLVYGNYLSSEDILIAKEYAIEKLEANASFQFIKSLHMTLSTMYPTDNDESDWDIDTRRAVERAMEDAEWDEETKTITFSGADERQYPESISNREDLEFYLTERAKEAFYASVPWEDGEAVFECNDETIVQNVLEDYEEQLEKFWGMGI